jgi:hypothetical protein
MIRKRKLQLQKYIEEDSPKRRSKSLHWGYALIVVSGLIELVDVLREAHYIF